MLLLVSLDKSEWRQFGVATFIEGAPTTRLRLCILRTNIFFYIMGRGRYTETNSTTDNNNSTAAQGR